MSDRTAALCYDALAFRAVDRVRVVGREAPVDLFEPSAPDADPDPRWARFAAALDHYRAMRFTDAAAAFEALAIDDPVARVYVARIARFDGAPPSPDWDGVTDLEEK